MPRRAMLRRPTLRRIPAWIVAILSTAPAELAAEMVYWTDGTDHTIRRATFDGQDVATVLSNLGDPDGISVDSIRRKIYWAERYGSVKRADLDGNNIELLAVDPVGGTGWEPANLRTVGPAPTASSVPAGVCTGAECRPALQSRICCYTRCST